MRTDLDLTSLTAIIQQALDVIQPGERVLAIIPDKTRDDNTHILFPIADEFLAERGVASFDVLVAQGTHPPMSESQKLSKIGSANFSGRLYDHRWDEPDELITLGELSAETVHRLTGGLIDQAVPVSINKLLAPGIYDVRYSGGVTVLAVNASREWLSRSATVTTGDIGQAPSAGDRRPSAGAEQARPAHLVALH